MTTRPCEFCADWDKKLRSDELCEACNGSKVLDIKACFCCAYEPGECACDADWSDCVHWED